MLTILKKMNIIMVVACHTVVVALPITLPDG